MRLGELHKVRRAIVVPVPNSDTIFTLRKLC
jgi:hypothetical protein